MYAIYARQSIDKKDSLSIEGQIELCKKYSGEDAVIYKDKGFSGKNTNRPAFLELMEAIEAGKIKKIYVYRLDRISRSISDFGKIWELLEKHGVQFQSVTEQFDTSTPMGRAMLNIVITFAQLERETTADRVKDNYIHRFTTGAWPGGPAPYGLDISRIKDQTGKTASVLIANPEKSEIVKRIFEIYSDEGMSLRKLAKELMQSGIHGPKREVWDNVTLSRLLHSPVYVKADEDVYWYYMSMGADIKSGISDFDGVHACNVIGQRDRGKNKYNSIENQKVAVANHYGLIDSKLWLKVQNKLSNNRQISLDNAGKYSWLTGILKCRCCGYAVKFNYIKGEDKLNLICSGKSNLKVCDAKISIDIRMLENTVEEKLIKVINECPAEDSSSMESEKAQMILELEQKIDRLVCALSESSEISAAYISKQIEKLHKEREKLLSADNNKRKSKLERINFANMTFEEKKLIAAQFIDRILLEGETAEIIWKI